MFILLRIRKNILKTTSTLILAIKKVFLKKPGLLNLYFTWKLAKTISNVLRVELSIFLAPTLVGQTLRPNFDAYAGS